MGSPSIPHFKDNGFFYVYYSAWPGPRRTVLSRFKVSNDINLADPASEAILLELPQPFANHNGGQLAFGPDGFLYLGLGDGGGDNRAAAQDNSEVLGSILRIDVHRASGGKAYGIPPDNPFVGKANVKDEIWVYAMRNP